MNWMGLAQQLDPPYWSCFLKIHLLLFFQLSVTGLLVLCFVRRANRIGYLVSQKPEILLTYFFVLLSSSSFSNFFFWRIMALQSHIWSRTDDIKRMLPMLLYCVSCFGPLISRREKPFKTDNFSPFSQIKLCGICCLASAVLCVVVTVTTTVIHMNRLQTLRECVYQGSIQTCTCFAGFFDPTMTHHDGNNHNRGGEDK